MRPSPVTGHYVSSFLVRLQWVRTDEEEPLSHLYGEVEHIQSGERWVVRDLAQLAALIEQKLLAISREEPPDPD
ncbi:MAG: hypothetical protein D6775_00875 [Caldilineae bacterium]|nr:MAG: hypothetical protein D6775_00875 [Caldilineae bacterium]